MKSFNEDFITNIKKYTQNRKPEFDNLLKVLARQKPDRYTLFEFFLNGELEEKLTERPQSADETEQLARTIDTFRICGYDYVTLHASHFSFNSISTNHGKASRSANADVLISDRDSFEAFQWPKVDDFDMTPLDTAAKLLPENMKVIVYGPNGVLENVIDLVGYDNLCFMLVDDPELVQMIFDKVGSSLLRYYELSAPHKAVGALISNDDWGFNTQTMLSTADMKKYVIPWHKKICDVIHKNNKPSILHSCGQTERVMPDICSMYNGKHSYEDKILPVEKAYDLYSDKVAILGGIDLDFVCRKTPQEIYERSCKILEQTSHKGGYALGSGNSIPYYVPVENYLAMISAAIVNS